MKRMLYLLPLLAMIIACGTQPAPTQDVSNMVSATLTAIAQANPQAIVPQPTFTPIPIQTQAIATQPTSIQSEPPILSTVSPIAHDSIPALGTITGSLSFPSSFGIPAMRIAFFNLKDGSASYTDTVMNQGTYSIDLPTGSYYVVAYPYSAGAPMAATADIYGGGYTQFVLCGSTAECTDHSLVPVTVMAGQTVTVNPGDWYAPAGTFPPMPNP